MPYASILPPRLHKAFAASVKLTFTRDGEKDVPVIRGSLFNVVVTNTEKIRIQKETIRKSDIQGLLTDRAAGLAKTEDVRAEVANLRLQAIASLPPSPCFRTGAPYGQSLDNEGRKTVDYLQPARTCSASSTPPARRISEAAAAGVVICADCRRASEGILKDVAGTSGMPGRTRCSSSPVVEDFFRDYGDVRLPNGAPAKLAIYFPDWQSRRAAAGGGRGARGARLSPPS
jgi:hypothetical protein